GDLVERLRPEALGGSGDGTPAKRTVKLDRRLVVGQRPDHQTLQPALHQVLARSVEQAATEPEPLELGAQVKLVHLAFVEEAARTVAPVVRVAGDLLAELQDGDAAALADRRLPPVGPAAVDQLLELVPGDDAAIGRTPRLVMALRDIHRVGSLGAANLYEGRTHSRIEATNLAAFKPYD